jgi:hypothetical protein
MDRGWKSGASATPPVAPGSFSTGYPTAGDPATSVPATKPGAWWFHMVTEELRGIILDAGAAPSNTDLTQVRDAIRVLAGKVVSSVAALRGVASAKYSRTFVTGYYAAGDGGGGQYFLDTSDTTSVDNGGTVIVGSDAGRWKLIATQATSVRQWGAKGDGVTDDSSAIQNAINYLAGIGGGELLFPKGKYVHATTLVFKNQISYRGAGKHNSGTLQTILYYTGTSDQVQINNPINSSTAADIVVDGVAIVAATRTAGKANIADVGSTFLQLRNVMLLGADYNLILDQTEIAHFHDVIFNGGTGTTACIWQVNGPDHTPGGSTYFSNCLHFDNCQINAQPAQPTDLVRLDGGTGVSFRASNFNGGRYQIRAAGMRNLSIDGACEMEGASLGCVYLAATRANGASSPPNRSVSIRGAFMISGGAGNIIGEANCCNYLEMVGNVHSLIPAGATPVAGLQNNINVVVAYNNAAEKNGNGSLISQGTWSALGFASASFVPFNNCFQAKSLDYLPAWAPTWTGSGSNPAIGNGTLSASYTRNLTSVTVQLKIIFGSTTTLGTGLWAWSLPFVEGDGVDWMGTIDCYDVSADAHFQKNCVVNANGTAVQTFNGTTGVTGTAPFAWAAGDVLRLSLTYAVPGYA